jgi:hypothetical protein
VACLRRIEGYAAGMDAIVRKNHLSAGYGGVKALRFVKKFVCRQPFFKKMKSRKNGVAYMPGDQCCSVFELYRKMRKNDMLFFGLTELRKNELRGDLKLSKKT